MGMSETNQSWNFDELSPEARRTAERAAEAAGMPLDSWLNQLIKYVSAMELKGEAPDGDNGFDKSIEALAASQSAADGPGAPSETPPSDDRQPGDLQPDDPLPDEEAWPGDDIGFGPGPADQPGEPFETDAPAPSDPPPPTSLPPDLLSPSRFEEEPPHERDIESAIGGWRRAGSLVPVVVRPDGRQKGHYEIITGAERWHAAKRLEMKLVPVAVTNVSDDDLLRATLIERLRRRSLSPIDEARTYRRILAKTGQSTVALATDIGCAPTLIADALQLLDLPDPVQAMLEDGKLTVLHARALLPADDAEALAGEVIARQLDIYQTEQLVRNPAAPPLPLAEAEPGDTGAAETGHLAPGQDSAAPDAPEAPEADDIRMVEKNLSSLLGVKVSIDSSGEAGVLSLHYGNKRGLRDFVSRLNREPPVR